MEVVDRSFVRRRDLNQVAHPLSGIPRKENKLDPSRFHDVVIYVCLFVCLFVCISRTADEPQSAIRLPSPPTAAALPSWMWSRMIFQSLPSSRLMGFHHDTSSALLQLVNQWLNFTNSRSHTFHYGSQNKNPGFHKNRTHDFCTTSRCARLTTSKRPLGRRLWLTHIEHVF